MARHAERPRADLERLIGETEAFEVEGPGGVADQVEVNAFWDHEPGGTIRVLASIDDGGFRTSFRPVVDGFLVDADGAVDMADLETRS
jgi:hypothetical protein